MGWASLLGLHKISPRQSITATNFENQCYVFCYVRMFCWRYSKDYFTIFGRVLDVRPKSPFSGKKILEDCTWLCCVLGMAKSQFNQYRAHSKYEKLRIWKFCLRQQKGVVSSKRCLFSSDWLPLKSTRFVGLKSHFAMLKSRHTSYRQFPVSSFSERQSPFYSFFEPFPSELVYACYADHGTCDLAGTSNLETRGKRSCPVPGFWSNDTAIYL